MSALKDQLTADMKTAMKAKDSERLGVVRLILAEVKQIEVDERIELDDDRINLLLTKMLKQRRDSIKQFADADRQDLVDKEQIEVNVIQAYLPEQLGEDELKGIVADVIAEMGVSGPQEMGNVMKAIRGKVQGRADMGVVSGLVKSALTS